MENCSVGFTLSHPTGRISYPPVDCEAAFRFMQKITAIREGDNAHYVHSFQIERFFREEDRTHYTVSSDYLANRHFTCLLECALRSNTSSENRACNLRCIKTAEKIKLNREDAKDIKLKPFF